MSTQNDIPVWGQALATTMNALVGVVEQVVAGQPITKPKPAEPELSDSERLANQIAGETARMTGKQPQQATEEDNDAAGIISLIKKGIKINR